MIDYQLTYYYWFTGEPEREYKQLIRAYTEEHAKGILTDHHWDDPITITKIEVVPC